MGRKVSKVMRKRKKGRSVRGVKTSSVRTAITFPRSPIILTPGYIVEHHHYHPLHGHASASRSPVLSSFVPCIWCLLRKSFHPLLLRICRRKALRVNGPISTQGPELVVVVVVVGCATAWLGRACARLDDVVKGLGMLTSLTSASLATTGTGAARISATWKSRTKVWRNQERRRPKKAGLAPRAGSC